MSACELLVLKLKDYQLIAFPEFGFFSQNQTIPNLWVIILFVNNRELINVSDYVGWRREMWIHLEEEGAHYSWPYADARY